MKKESLRFRQVHLDFHTSPYVEDIGAAFEKKAWQEVLQAGHVDSITCFSKCHHGLSYHPTGVGVQHPNLNFNLLRAEMDACHEIDVRVPVYLSAGLDNTITRTHPEWREMDAQGRLSGWNRSPLEAGFHMLCFNTPYLDYLCHQIEEVVTLFPDANGIFLDIVSQGQCCCNWCMDVMAKNGLDPEQEEDRKTCARLALERYYKAATAACKVRDAAMPVFHNSGHVSRCGADVLKYQSHLELESLPTGGWGYDHFPESASFVSQLGLDFLGMTGKFHLSWGEFGGFKHPNALRYECAAMLAVGAKCSVGDQLHPDGQLDRSTYELIGAAYSEVEKKEPWCRDSVPVADIAVLSSEAENGLHEENSAADTGVCRILLEGHQLFALVDRQADFSAYKLLILPDNIAIDAALKQRIDDYLAKGGKLLLTGRSGLWKGGDGFAFDIGAEFSGPSPFAPDYLLPAVGLRPSFVNSPFVSYASSMRIKVTAGESLGQIFDPYFNRSYEHFSSHKHTPYRPAASGFDSGVRHDNIVYLAHPSFTVYRKIGAVAQKEYLLRVTEGLLGEDQAVLTNLPSGARLTLRSQPSLKCQVVHLVYANKHTRGGKAVIWGGALTNAEEIDPPEVIEELDPLHGTTVAIQMEAPVTRVMLEPQGRELAYELRNGRVEFTVDSFVCHQMVVIHQA